jgi:hypothetical protein
MKLRKAAPYVSTKVQVKSASVSGTNAATGPASASMTFGANGVWSSVASPQGSGTQANYNWLLTGVVADYEVMFSDAGGDPATGTFDQWLSLSTSRSVSISAPIENSYACSFIAKIRSVATGIVEDSGYMTLDATGGFAG